MKSCIKCHISKDLIKFEKKSSAKGGIGGRCKSCVNKINRDKRTHKRLLRDSYIGPVLDTSLLKFCTDCARTKSLDSFHKDRRLSTGRKNICHKCASNKAAIYRAANPDKAKEVSRRHRQANPEYHRKRQRIYGKQNPHIINAQAARRRAAKLQATPSWLTSEQHQWIGWHYKHAAVMSKMYGIEYQVDHIGALQAELSRGLHVPWNLQVITRSENASKGNRMPT